LANTRPNYRDDYYENVDEQFNKLKDDPFNRPILDPAPQEGTNANASAPFYSMLNIENAGQLDETESFDTLMWIPDRVPLVIEAKALVIFREFWAPAKAAKASSASTSDAGGGQTSSSTSTPSGGGSTSGSGGSSSPTTSGTPHAHVWAEYIDDTPAATTNRQYQDGLTSSINVTLGTAGGVDLSTAAESGGGHTHSVTIASHTHSTPAHTHPGHTHDVDDHDHNIPGHTHDLDYGMFKETMPASHDVTLTLYKRLSRKWVEIATVTGLTDDEEEIDLTSYFEDDPGGQYKISLQSEIGEPNDGRLGADLVLMVLAGMEPQ
jgi:hypothetical protein